MQRCRCPSVGVRRAQGAWDKPRGSEAHQSCPVHERRGSLLAQSIIISSEEEKKHLTLKKTLPSQPQCSGQRLTHLTSSPSWPRKLGRVRSGNAVAQLPSLLAARRGAGAACAAPGLGEGGFLLKCGVCCRACAPGAMLSGACTAMPALGVMLQPWQQSILRSDRRHVEHPRRAPGAAPWLGTGMRAAGPSSHRRGRERSPSARVMLGGGGSFALFTLQLWLWLEFVKGSG